MSAACEFAVGDRVESPCDGGDAGVVLDVRYRDGDCEVLVGWDTGVQTWTPVDDDLYAEVSR